MKAAPGATTGAAKPAASISVAQKPGASVVAKPGASVVAKPGASVVAKAGASVAVKAAADDDDGEPATSISVARMPSNSEQAQDNSPVFAIAAAAVAFIALGVQLWTMFEK